MRKLLLCLFLFLSLNSANAQKSGFLIGGGYTMGFYNNLDGLNHVVDDYNSTHPWLSTKMPAFGFMPGAEFDGNFYFYNFMMKFGWTGNNATNRASGIDNTGKKGYREIRMENNVVNLGFGLGGMANRGGGFLIMAADMGTAPSYTRTWYEGDKIPEFTSNLFDANFDVGISFSAELYLRIKKGIFIAVKPYYEFNVLNYDFAALDGDVNLNGTAPADDAPFTSHPTHFGIDIKILFGDFE